MSTPRVAMITLGCARNEVDSEELAARLATAGFELVDDAEDADAVVVNTCGFVEAAKKDSIDTILAASQLGDDDEGDTSGPVVVAVGCLAERYGNELAEALPEADAVLGFDDYPDMADRLRAVMAGESLSAHQPRDRRALLPITPVDRAEAVDVSVPGHAGERIRLTTGPVANVKLASGCDRRCSFCAIPSFRGSFVSRRPADVLADIRVLVRDGVHEVHLVSENSTSYGKDLGDLRLLETLLPECARLVDRVRVAYLQPAEMRPGLIQVIADTAGVAPYFDLSYQHASGPVLKRMRRFGDAESFLGLLNSIRAITPEAGVRSNFIVGFPGETDEDFQVLVEFLTEARLDAIGVFAYSDEDGTEAAGFADKVPADVIADRYATLTDLVEQLVAERAEERIGTIVDVLIETVDDSDTGHTGEGRAAHQGPDDGSTLVRSTRMLAVGQIVPARVVATDGVDLIAETL